MDLHHKVFKLKGKIQHYDWGGYNFIPHLLGIKNDEHVPCAEYWMGAHPSASSELMIDKKPQSLYQLIKEMPAEILSTKVLNQFGELPYLLKILDVKNMLSIQVHPSKTEAAKGFEEEERMKIPINHPQRNYKDKNHKPEIMVALTEFWLLQGFKPKEEIEKTLKDIRALNVLQPLFKTGGYKALYQFVMEMEQENVDSMLADLIQNEIRRKQAGELSKADAGWWVSKLFERKNEMKNIDRGVFSIYFFNIVQVNKGEAVFQNAGMPHAYLEGVNVELMANSDNVLRGGLTNKHIDVQELMKHIVFAPVSPHIIQGEHSGFETIYPCAVADFGISKIQLQGDEIHHSLSTSLEIIIAVEGGYIINTDKDNLPIKQGEALAILPDTHYSIVSSGNCLLFKAFVPMQA
jgi:mannose-6-phosphate isomerase